MKIARGVVLGILIIVFILLLAGKAYVYKASVVGLAGSVFFGFFKNFGAEHDLPSFVHGIYVRRIAKSNQKTAALCVTLILGFAISIIIFSILNPVF